MIELILVMVVMGIVASISSSLIVKVYEGYILQKAVYKASVSTEIVSTQLVNRLTYAITDSIIARKIGTDTKNISDIKSIQNLNLDDDDKEKFGILEWIGYANDSFSAQTTPGWSGYCDINRSEEIGTSQIIRVVTPGSDLDFAENTIEYLGKIGGKRSTIDDGAVLFSGGEYTNFKLYDPSCMGFVNSDCISEILTLETPEEKPEIRVEKNVDSNQKKIITDQYKLVWSAYAVVPENFDEEKLTYDLFLYSNYQPWLRETYTDGDKNLLARNVTQFKFYGQGSIIRFKICIREETGFKVTDPTNNLGLCKEKVVIK
jgi:Tfp pilus assembly major pilin PilA